MLAHKSTSIIVILVAIVFVSTGKCSEAGNWFTKSLDYYSLEKCSPLDKSNMAGDFNACMNSPVDPSSTSATAPASGKTSGWGSSGSTSSGSFSPQSVKGFNFQDGSNSGSSSSTKQSTGDSWPISLISELQQIVNCFPKLLKPCMTKSEQDFYLTIRDFFQAQIDYGSANASSIAKKIASSGCVKSNSIDTSTVCFSTNLHNQNWFGWKINWIDGQMCHFINDISTCEVKSFDKCPPEVKQFAIGLWEAGLKVTPCSNQTDETTATTKAFPSSSPPDNSNQNIPVSQISSSKTSSPVKLSASKSDIDRVDKALDDQPIEQPIKDQDRFDDAPHKRSNHRDSLGWGKKLFGNANDVFRGNLEHSKLVRLHEVDGEGESRHDRGNRHKGVTEEQWSRIKEEYRRKMRESEESRESDEDEYENESEESDEDKRYDIIGDQSKRIFFNPHFWIHQQRNNFDQDFGDYYRNRFLRIRRSAADDAKDREEMEREKKADEAERVREEAEEQREIDDQIREEQAEEQRQKDEEAEEAKQDEEERLQQIEEERQEAEEAKNEKKKGKRLTRSVNLSKKAKEKEEEAAEKTREKEQENKEKEQEKAEAAREKEEEAAEEAREKEEQAKEDEEEAAEAAREQEEEEEEERQELEEKKREAKKDKSKRIKRDVRGRNQWEDYEERDREEQERQRERLLERAGRVKEAAKRRLETIERQRKEREERLKRIREEADRRHEEIKKRLEKADELEYLDMNRLEELQQEANRRSLEALKGRDTFKHRYEDEDEERREQIQEEADRRREENERQREEAERRQSGRREGNNDDNLIVQPQRHGKGNFMNNQFNNNRRNNDDNGDDFRITGFTLKDCIKSASNSWSYVSQNHKNDDIMEIMCRNIDSVHSCLDKHASTNDPSTSHRLNHLKVTHQALCDSNNKPRDLNQVKKIKQCIIDQQSSNLPTSNRQTRYPDIFNRRPNWQ